MTDKEVMGGIRRCREHRNRRMGNRFRLVQTLLPIIAMSSWHQRIFMLRLWYSGYFFPLYNHTLSTISHRIMSMNIIRLVPILFTAQKPAHFFVTTPARSANASFRLKRASSITPASASEEKFADHCTKVDPSFAPDVTAKQRILEMTLE